MIAVRRQRTDVLSYASLRITVLLMSQPTTVKSQGLGEGTLWTRNQGGLTSRIKFSQLV